MTTSSTTCFPHVTDLALGGLADVVGGTLRLAAMPPRDGDMAAIERIVTDVRHVQRGDVYWAIPGKPCASGFDSASDCAYEALMRGAAGVVANHRVEPFAGRWSIEVADPVVALWELARWKRNRFCGQMIALLGDESDTLAATLIDCVLRCRMTGAAPTSSDPLHDEPRVALPLTMLNVDAADDYAIAPLQGDDAEQAEAAARLCRPQVVVAMGSANPARVKRTASLLSSDACAIVCGDEPTLRRSLGSNSANVRTFGRGGDCDYAATNVEYAAGCLRCEVEGTTLCVRVWGRHHLHAVLAAYAVGRTLGLEPREIAAALAAFLPPPDRSQVTESEGLTIIHEAPRGGRESLVALELLRETTARGRRFVLCGDEDAATDAARDLRKRFGGDVVCRAGADRFVAYGRDAREIVAAARDAGMPLGHAIACRVLEDAARYVAEESQPGDVLLINAAPREAVKKILASRGPQTTTLRRAA